MAVYYNFKIQLIPSSLLRIASRLCKKNFYRYKVSALFIPGSRASNTFSYLTPDLNFNERLADVNKLNFELNCRNININARELKESWDFYKHIESNRHKIESQRDAVANKVAKLLKDDKLNNQQQMIEGLKLQAVVLKKDLRIIKEVLWELEETIIPKLLDLPNEIDEKTPLESVILRSNKSIEPESNQIQVKSHLDIGQKLGLMDCKYRHPLWYFLVDEAALFEIGAMTWAGKTLDSKGLMRVTGTDFAQSFVVEAAEIDHDDPDKSIIISNHEQQLEGHKNSINKLHLIGGANFISFLVMHTKQLINHKSLPMKFFAVGRQYTPPSSSFKDYSADRKSHGLFKVNQECAVQCFIVMKGNNSAEYQYEFQKMINIILKMYDELEVCYRVVLKSASELRPWESLKISFELWSKYKRNYIEVGHLSMCGDYCSKRLQIVYQMSHDKEYPFIITGTVLSITKLLGCLLEENDDKFIIPDCIKKLMPINDENL